MVVEQAFSAEIVDEGKEDGHVVGYLEYGSMVVVNQPADMLGSTVLAEVERFNPTSGGRLVFGKLLGKIDRHCLLEKDLWEVCGKQLR